MAEGFLFQPCGTDKTGKGWAREDAAARSFVEWLVQQVETELPTEARAFRGLLTAF